MPDIPSAIAIFSALSGSLVNSINVAKHLQGLAVKKDDPEIKQAVSDFLTSLMEFQTEFMDVKQRFQEELDRLHLINHQWELRKKLVRRESYYEFSDPVDGFGSGPFCLNCTDLNRFPIGVPVNSVGHFKCSKCDSEGWIEGAELKATKTANANMAAMASRLKHRK